jgi:hypothetical protein
MIDRAEKKYYDPTLAIFDYLDISYGEDEYYEKNLFFKEEDEEDGFGFGSGVDDDVVMVEDCYFYYENE